MCRKTKKKKKKKKKKKQRTEYYGTVNKKSRTYGTSEVSLRPPLQLPGRFEEALGLRNRGRECRSK